MKKHKTREDIICGKIDKREEICAICRHYVQHRTPERIEKYGEHTGRCFRRREKEERELDAHVVGDARTPVVNDYSTCDGFESIFGR